MPEQARLLTSGQAAAMLSVTPETVRRWAAGGLIRRVKTPGGQWRFRVEDIEAMRTPDEPTAATG